MNIMQCFTFNFGPVIMFIINDLSTMQRENVSMKNDFLIKMIGDHEKKSAYTKGILENLPEWFGNKEALDDYVVKVRELPYWAAQDTAGNCVGFFSVKTHYGNTGDIFVCGVLPRYQNNGIGKALYDAAEKYLVENGCKYAIVKTLSDIVNYEPYAQTRNFYKNIGFEPLITLTEMWDEENPCLIMIKLIN